MDPGRLDAYPRGEPGVADTAIFVDSPMVRFSAFDPGRHGHGPLRTPYRCATYRVG